MRHPLGTGSGFSKFNVHLPMRFKSLQTPNVHLIVVPLYILLSTSKGTMKIGHLRNKHKLKETHTSATKRLKPLSYSVKHIGTYIGL